MTRKNQALLVGYYGLRNTGDDAFLAITAWGVRNHLGGGRLCSTSAAVPHLYGVPVRPVHQPFPLPRLNRLLESLCAAGSHSIVFGGGSNFHSSASIEHRRRLVRRAGTGPHLAVGVSLGPFRNGEAERACGRLLQELAFVGVRDEISLARARDLAPSAQVALTFDLAPLLPHAAGMSNAAVTPGTRIGLGVSLCNYERHVHGDLDAEAVRPTIVAEALNRCAADGVVDEIVLIDFNGHPHYGDAEVHRKLAAALSPRIRVTHLAYDPDSAAVMRRIGALRGMIAMRLHAAVFAFCQETPCVCLAYHEKVREWAGTIGAPHGSMLDTATLEAGALEKAVRLAHSPQAPLPALSPREARERAMLNWQFGPAQ